MPDTNQTNTTTPTPAPVVDTPAAPASETPAPAGPNQSAYMQDVAAKITDAHNILVALSSDPSVDDLAAAIGLSLYLDRIGKRATAIYSGNTPNALEFLKPDETFDVSTDALQDFVIALNKEKADHLRYKLDGEYVKIFITPYKSRIAESDLDFSYGDYNVDLVIALDVANGTDLDSALREHGRIMHDATVVNITTAHPGKFGEIEWSNPHASSVSEMAASLLHDTGSDNPIAPEEATAFLTGIIAATDRFSAANTTPDTMKVASDLMAAGADQQLINQNIADASNQLFSLASPAKKIDDPTALDVQHEDEEGAELTEAPTEEPTTERSPEPIIEPVVVPAVESTPESEAPEPITAPEPSLEPSEDLLSDLKATEESLAHAGAETVPEPKSEKIIVPPEDFAADPQGNDTNKYSQMIDDALAEAKEAEAAFNPALAPAETPAANPAASIAPPVATAPEINGVPEIDYMPLPSDEVLPPPPTPPINFENTPLPEPPAPAEVPTPEAPAPEVPATPAPEIPAPTPDAGAFKIPGV